ncbi:hypothetical protein NESM_000683100 [Novymonas esmeraldas]|uniref:Rhodanese domain-containing protein n=1 Tax=Novymonas esmeraldas TaxID=1808958 RepID=A0AAW0EX70_9TRYP
MSLPEFTHPFSIYETQAVVRALESGSAAGVYLFDVREDFEVKAVPPLPRAVVVHFRDLEAAMKMWGAPFKNKYGVPKPSKKDRILVYALNARRASSAAAYLVEIGYRHTAYLGATLSEYLDSTQGGLEEDL